MVGKPCGAKSLKKLSKDFLGVTIQEGAHSSVIDARASLALYRIVEREWENTLKQKYSQIKQQMEQDLHKINSFFNGAQGIKNANPENGQIKAENQSKPAGSGTVT